MICTEHDIYNMIDFMLLFSSRRRHTRCALVTGVQTCALPISKGLGKRLEPRGSREPFRSYFEPGEVRSGAASCGFGVVEDIGPGEMVMRYCAGRADPLHPRPSFRIAHLCKRPPLRSEEHTSDLPSLLRLSYAVFCLKKKPP